MASITLLFALTIKAGLARLVESSARGRGLDPVQTNTQARTLGLKITDDKGAIFAILCTNGGTNG